MKPEPLRLLLLDPQATWAEPLLPALPGMGLLPRLCRHGAEAKGVLCERWADLVVVGVVAGVSCAADLARWMREHPPGLPLVAVGPRLEESLRVRLLETWADDVLPLPLALPEFAARCRALRRRSQLRRVGGAQGWRLENQRA